MPVIFTKDGFRVFFYSADWTEPMHVHVEYGEGEAKFWMKPLRLASSYRMKGKDLKNARELTEKYSKQIEDAWHEHFGNKTRK